MESVTETSATPASLIVQVRGVAPYRVWEGLLTEIRNFLLRERQEASPGFDVEVVAVLNDGTRVTDRYSKRHFKTFTLVPVDTVDVSPEPSRAYVERAALASAGDSPAGRWHGLMRALADVGVRTSEAELDWFPIHVELDELAEQLCRGSSCCGCSSACACYCVSCSRWSICASVSWSSPSGLHNRAASSWSRSARSSSLSGSLSAVGGVLRGTERSILASVARARSGGAAAM